MQNLIVVQNAKVFFQEILRWRFNLSVAISQKKTNWSPLEDSYQETRIGVHEKEENAINEKVKSINTFRQEKIIEAQKNNDIEKRKLEFSKLETKKQERIPIEKRERPIQQDTQGPDQSLIINQIRELVLDFDSLLKKYLNPDFPLRRVERKKFADEINRFRLTGFREYIRTLKIKVDALCSFEDYSKEMFNLNGQKSWFDTNVKRAIDEKNFESAQAVVNSVMQLVMQDEIIMTKRKVVSQMR